MTILIYEFQNRRLGPGSYNIDVGGFNSKAVSERSAGPGKYRPSDRVREENKNCARFWGQIVRGKTPIVRELCGIAQSSDLPKNSVVSKSSLRNTLPSSASIILSSDIS